MKHYIEALDVLYECRVYDFIWMGHMMKALC